MRNVSWAEKQHIKVTLKTGVMDAKNSAFYNKNKYNFKQY